MRPVLPARESSRAAPLSPMLFGLFIDCFHFMVTSRAQGLVRPRLHSGRRLPLLFCADDGLMPSAVLSIDPDGMPSLCECLDRLCRRSHMRVNLPAGKTEAMTVAVSDAMRPELKQWHYFTIAQHSMISIAQYNNLGCTWAAVIMLCS